MGAVSVPFEEVVVEEPVPLLAIIRPKWSIDTLVADAASKIVKGKCPITMMDTEDPPVEVPSMETRYPRNRSAKNFKAAPSDATIVSGAQDEQDTSNDHDAYTKHMEDKIMTMEKEVATNVNLEPEQENGVMRGKYYDKERHHQARNRDEPTIGPFPFQNAHSPMLIIPHADQGIASTPNVFREYPIAGNGIGRSGNSIDEGLAFAITVEDIFTSSIEYDLNAKPPILKNRRFRFYAFVGVLLCIAIIVGVIVIVVDLIGNGSDAFPPTQSPSISPSSREEGIYRTQIVEVVGVAVMQAGSPPDKVSNWIIFLDPLNLSADALNLIQRYLLVLFYYMTTDNGNRPLLSCNPPEGDDDISCVLSELWRESNDSLTSTPAVCWLSGSHECEWVGNLCDDLFITRSLEICKYFIIIGWKRQQDTSLLFVVTSFVAHIFSVVSRGSKYHRTTSFRAHLLSKPPIHFARFQPV